MKNLKLNIALVLTALVTIIAACTKEQIKEASREVKNANPAELVVKMTDNPGDYLGLNMQIVKVEAYLEGSGWVTLNSATQMVDVAKLTNGNEKIIATKGNLQAGHYTQLKITFGTENTITVMADADNSDLRVAHETSIAFEGERTVIVETDVNVSATAGAELLVDFDIVKSVISGARGFIIKPVIVWIRDTRTALAGRLQGNVTAVLVLTNGTDSFSVLTDFQGRFYFKGIKPGTYTLIVYPLKKFRNILWAPRRIEGILVVDGTVVYLGKIKI